MSVVINMHGGLTGCANKPLWQYDYGQIAEITETNLPDGVITVHFQKEYTDSAIQTMGTVSGGTVTAEIPNQLLDVTDKFNYTIFCYIYYEDATSGTTIYTGVIAVSHRAKRTDEEPTPAQKTAWDAAIETLQGYREMFDEAIASCEEAVDQTEQDVLTTTQKANEASASALEASVSADRAEQAAATSGWIFFDIVDGDLIMQRTSNTNVDFSLVDGDLIMEAIV